MSKLMGVAAKLIKGALALLGTVLVLAIVGPLIWAMNPFARTERAYCVVVADVKDFTGTYLLHRAAESKRNVKITECEERDRQIDGGDGMRAGRVRWVVCPKGPDCDEAGRF
jgi:hypothetical protein